MSKILLPSGPEEAELLGFLTRRPGEFSRLGGLTLRRYQLDVASAVIDSVVSSLGRTFVVMFPRQSGKNELQAQIEALLMVLYRESGAEIVKVSPTWKPQSQNAMRRLERVLDAHPLTKKNWERESGYIFRLGKARVFFLSGSPEAHIVGATASTLLEVDEAQDVRIAKFDKDIAPMAASTNATRVFWGTAWTSQTLLARELRACRVLEAAGGARAAFVLTADDVAAEVPVYGQFVAEQVARLGRRHPSVRTQYFSEEIDAEGGMFPPERRALMVGSHPRRVEPEAGAIYALLLDVAGEDESARDAQQPSLFDLSTQGGKRDSTALTIVEVDLAGLHDPVLRAPGYRVVERRLWTGARHALLYAQVKALAELWNPRWLVVDATGVGAGLAAFLEKALPGKVLPFVFSQASKSRLGWDFLNLVDAGRFHDYEPGPGGCPLAALFWKQVEACQYSVREAVGRSMRWGVPDGTRDLATGEFVHDDLLVSAALCAVLDGQEWYSGAPAVLAGGRDPLEEMDREGF